MVISGEEIDSFGDTVCVVAYTGIIKSEIVREDVNLEDQSIVNKR